MKKKVNLNKLVFDKKIYKKNINTSFSQLGSPSTQEQLDEQPSIEEFFNMYTDLFYQINEVGPNKSHEFLIKSSGEYIKFDEQDDLIQSLQQEIVNIKKELLKSEEINKKLFPEEVTPAQEDLPNEDEIELPPRISPLLNIINTPIPPPPPPPPTLPPLPPASPADQLMYKNGYTYQAITYKALEYNIRSMNDLQSVKDAYAGDNNIGIGYFSTQFINYNDWDNPFGTDTQMLKDLQQAKDDGSTKVGEEGTYTQWRAAIKNKASGRHRTNLYTVLAITTDYLRETFRETNKFGTGKITPIEFVALDRGVELDDITPRNTSGYSSFNYERG